MFRVVIPVLNQHAATERFLQSWFDLSKKRISILFIDNGSEEKLSDQPFLAKWAKVADIEVVRNDQNIGVYPTFKQAFEITDSQFLFFSHNDVEMVEFGWDEKINDLLFTLLWRGEKVGVCGMYGARIIGHHNIYKVPYHFSQLARWDCVTTESMLGVIGRLINGSFEEVVVLDGFTMIINREMVKKIGGIKCDEYPVHHNYDNDICLESYYAGFKNYALNVDCLHHGGVTSTREKWAEKMGTTDFKIHRLSHEVMYQKYRGRLPVVIK